MARCIFDNLTIEQARCLAHYWESQGEQSCEIWFDIGETPIPYADVDDKGWLSEEGDDIIVKCKTIEREE